MSETPYVKVLLPLAVKQAFTYSVPEEFAPSIEIGKRVEVSFGKRKHYAGLIIDSADELPDGVKRVKPILSVLDDQPVVLPEHLRFWKWLSSYYACTMGEVMQVSLPSALKLESETHILWNQEKDMHSHHLSDEEYLLAEALTIQDELTISDARGILDKKTVYPVLTRLMNRDLVRVRESLKEKFKPKTVTGIRFSEKYRESDNLNEAFEATERSKHQTNLLLSMSQMKKKAQFIERRELIEHADATYQAVRALEKKGIIELYDHEISRLDDYSEDTEIYPNLSNAQQEARDSIRELWEDHRTVLLHGITGSGKTHIYLDFIERAIEEGEQVLYLLPEIALTDHIINRIRKHLGNDVLVYHSRLNDHERVETWHRIIKGHPVIISARSGLFLPFVDLSLVIVDEEHDASFKQQNPAPRYHGRDAAIYLAQQNDATVLLGSATPSVETYHNAMQGKYGLVSLNKRYQDIQMPEITFSNLKEARRRKEMHAHFTEEVIHEMEQTLERGKQVIAFRNRRGYAPTLHCPACNWNSECKNCDVSLTYHKYKESLNCHYCGYQIQIPSSCPYCGNEHLALRGAGTEKLEEELAVLFDDYTIKRMDYETAGGKNAARDILHEFGRKRIDILVGTQMISKGLDFEDVGLVVIVEADQMLHFPDFRSHERAMQLLTQVSGRAGRKGERGSVLIQTWNPKHDIFRDVESNNYLSFYQREISERQQFKYPPFRRLIDITLRHKKKASVRRAARRSAELLEQHYGDRVRGPSIPRIERLRGYYHRCIQIRCENHTTLLGRVKRASQKILDEVTHQKGLSNVRTAIDVDPVQ